MALSERGHAPAGHRPAAAAVRGLLAAIAVAVLVPVLAPPAAAHGGAATFEVLEAEEVTPGMVGLQVAVSFEADGHDATGAIVDVVPTSPDGEPSPAVRLTRDETGAYAAVLDLREPGAWTLDVTSAFPPGSTEVAVEVGDGAAAAEPVEEVAASEPDGTSERDVLDEPEVGGAEGGSDTTNIVVAVASGLVGGALGLWVSRRRSARRRNAPGG